ncbi:MAG: FkbM family methyltransferase [Verrucomicrobia bacterium]|nr:FkbM family methyltransferase [Verrucomicrobiota bacterium]
MKLPPGIRRPLVRARRTVFEALGSERYSRPALHGLDRKLDAFLERTGGFFVEAGANDGFAQSNTYHLERWRGWSGILIEPIPELAAECRKNRPRSIVVQAALVAPDHTAPEVEMQFAGLMSVVDGAFGDAARRQQHVTTGRAQRDAGRTYAVRVPARTLSAILAAHARGRAVDLLSLDVEGAELTALAGLDLAQHAPRLICVEARAPAAVAALLGGRYEQVAVLSDNGEHQDLLFRRR